MLRSNTGRHDRAGFSSGSRLWVAMILLGLVSAALPVQAGKIVCWTDENGNRSCGDRVPPQYAKKERKVYNDRGLVVDTQERELTAEERRQKELLEQNAERDQLMRLEQARYDRFLMQTYAEESQLEHARDERLAMVDSRIRLTEKSAEDNRAAVENLLKQEKTAKGVKKKEAQDMRAHFESALSDSQQAIKQMYEERARIQSDFDRDIQRFRQLKAESQE